MGSDGMQIHTSDTGYTVQATIIILALYTCQATLNVKPLVTSALLLCNSYQYDEFPVLFAGPTFNLSVAVLYAL